MGDLKSRIANVARQKLLRRGSAASAQSAASSAASDEPARRAPSSLRKSVSLAKLPEVSTHDVEESGSERQLSKSAVLPQRTRGDLQRSFESLADNRTDPSLQSPDRQSHENTSSSIATTSHTHSLVEPQSSACPAVTLEEPTPIPLSPHPVELTKGQAAPDEAEEHPSPLRSSTQPTPSRPPAPVRRQSLVTTSNARIIKTLLEPDVPASGAPPSTGAGPLTSDYFTAGSSAFNAGMLHRKIWVKRPNASATLVQIREDDLVDDVRDMILKKYANSLGRSFDAPDVVLRIVPREHNGKAGEPRILGPEEEMCATLDNVFPGGQNVNEALVIEVPQRRTPKPSPGIHHHVPYYYATQDSRPLENAQEYFPPMPVVNPSPAAMTAHSHDSRATLTHAPHSIAVLQTGQLPPLPSPGSTRRGHHGRPKYPRHNTASPTALTGAPTSVPTARPAANRPRHDSSASESKHATSSNPPIPTPPAAEGITVHAPQRQNSTPPTPRVSSPRPDKKRKKPKQVEPPSLPAGLLDNSVPPINVLIVEDNIINLRVLGAFMQRLKVRWQRAMNGKEAVEKWRAGGFHLVLMDIQLPIMNGLEATKEIRRLEKVNSIGVFSSGSSQAPNHKIGDDSKQEGTQEEDKLGDSSLFKSPVIIVALTASSLQSDRHEALAAGCNDFLTKPVNFVWLERKVKEWGCMQALIDFDGWRKWKDFASQSDSTDATSKLSSSYSSVAGKTRVNSKHSPTSGPITNGNASSSGANGVVTAPKKDEEKKSKRKSIGTVPPPVLEEKEGNASTPDTDG